MFQPVPALVSTAHNINEGGAVRYFGYRVTDALSELTTNVSHSAVDRYVELGVVSSAKSAYVPNGINLRRFSRSVGHRKKLREELGAQDHFIWLTVGRITEQKDYPNLLHGLHFQESLSTLWLVGDGELRDAVQAQAAELGLEQRVKFLGVRTDVGALMSAADGFVLGSAWEGLPITLLEAAASELPAVATDVGGVSEVVTPGAGWLVPPKDPTALAQAMNELESKSLAEREEMGRKARAVALEKFDIVGVVDKWEALFKHMVGTAAGRSARRAYRLDSDGVHRVLAGCAEA